MTLDELIETLERVRAERGNGFVAVEVVAAVYDHGPNARPSPYGGDLSAVDSERMTVQLVADSLHFDGEEGC